MKGMIQSLEMMAMQRSSRDNLDISKFTDSQRDKLLDIMSKNEDNAFKFHNKRLEVTEKLNTKIRESTTVSQRTIRYIGILALLLISALMVIILVYKDQYFPAFLSFIAGLGGGFGLKGGFDKVVQKPTLVSDDNDDEDK